MNKTLIKVTGAYGMDLILPTKEGERVRPHPAEMIPASHGIFDCGHHYNIFEEDDGFPQDRFFEIQKDNLLERR